MQKLYSAITILFTSLFLLGATSQAQNTITNQTYTINGSRNWSVTVGPTNTICDGCTFNISGTATFTVNVPVTLRNSTINVANSSILQISANTSLFNTKIIIGDASQSETNVAPGTAKLNVANNASLNLLENTSTIRLANANNTVTAGSGTGAGTINYTPTTGGTYNLFSGSQLANTIIGHTPGSNSPYFNNPERIVGPAISGVTILFNQPFASFTQAIIILPITLVDFYANLNDDGSVGLTWATEQELNSSYFNVQRNVNGLGWETIGKVDAQGKSNVKVSYSFTDADPGTGTISYRLQPTDLNGTYTYSEVKVIRTTSFAGIKIFPNPVKDNLNISLGNTSDATIRLVDINGKVLLEKKVSNAANTIVTLPVLGYPQGNYFLQLRTPAGTKFTSKVLITRQ